MATRYAQAIVGMVASFALTSAAHAADEQVCIEPAAEAALNCESGARQAITKRRGVTFSAPQVKEPKAREAFGKPGPPQQVDEETADLRRARTAQPKQRRLLEQEIRNVTRLLQTTPEGDKDHPVLLRRLAEGYAELESSAFRAQLTNEDIARDTRKTTPERQEARRRAKIEKQILVHARSEAIGHYTRLADLHPTFCSAPQKPVGDQGCIDEVFYFLAYEHEQAQHLDKARDAYLKLVTNHPKSKYLPHAFLAFGELFFNQAQGDPSKWKPAEQAYDKVKGFAAPGNKLWGYATYKLGYVYWNQGEFKKALGEFKQVIDFGKRFSDLPNAQGLTKAARRDLIPVYALAGQPRQAHDFFKPLSGDANGESTRTFGMMEELGQSLLDTGKYEHAIALYDDLLKRDRGDHVCSYQAHIARATMALHSGKKAPIENVLNTQLATYLAFKNRGHAPEANLECANATASLLSETAMAWHIEAVGNNDTRGTGDKKTMAASDRLYRLAVDNFSGADFARFKFPQLIKQDWPTRGKLLYAMGDLQYHNQDWQACGPTFDQAFAEAPKGPDAGEALFASAVCWRKHFDSIHPLGTRAGESTAERLAPRQLTDEQKGMLAAFDRYVCNIKPPKSDKDALAQLVDVKYARAWTYYEAGHFDKAGVAFRDIALNHPDFEDAVKASHLYLESLNVMVQSWQPKRSSCIADMRRDMPKILASYCNVDNRDDEQCPGLEGIDTDLEIMAGIRKIQQADDGAPNSQQLYVEGAEQLFALWKTRGEPACLEKTAQCKRYEIVLFNAASAFQAAHRLANAIQVRKLLASPRFGLHETNGAKQSMLKLAGNYQAIAVYDQAADWYERYAAANAKDEQAARALKDAIVLHLGLGQHEDAMRASKTFRDLFGTRRPSEAAHIAFAIAAHHADNGQWSQARQKLSGAMAQIDRHATFDVQLQAHGLLARSSAALERDGDADREYASVRAATTDSAALRKKFEAIDGSAEAKNQRRRKVLQVMGESFYHLAEKERRRAEALPFPQYRGDGSTSDVNRFMDTRVREWIGKKRGALDDATRAYKVVVDLNGGAPPPRWAIASGAAVGGLWSDFHDDIVGAPYPKQWDEAGYVPGITPPLRWHELRDAYKARLMKEAAPFSAISRKAYEDCLDYGIIYQHFDGELRTCEEWLSSRYPNEFQVVDEFRGAPTRTGSGLAERARAVTVAGKPVDTN